MKTQSQINARLDTYKNGTVDSPYRVKTWTSYDPAFSTMEPGCVDVDHFYHAQCADLPTDYILWLTDNQYKAWGNAKDFPNNKFPTGWKVIENMPETVPQKGWIAVFTSGTYAQYGHIGIVYNGGNTNSFQILEQNWNGYANKKPTLRWDNYYGLTHFIVPPVAKEFKVLKTETKKAPTQTNKTKTKKIEVNTKRITGWTMDKRGYNPHGVVIHNDAGSANSQNYYNSLVNANYDRLARGIAHAYADRNGIWEAIDESRIAWHCADGINPGSGNHDFYGIEVNQSLSASDKEFLANEQAVFQFAAQKLKKWGLPANRNTVRLHNEFSQTSCPHRSMKLHAGLDPIHNSITEQARLKLKDYFIKQIRAYMAGKQPTSTTIVNKPGSASTPATRTNSNGWKVNQYGTYYKAEHATFTPNTAIRTRYIGPFTSCPQAGVLQAGQSIIYDTVCKQDGYIWVSYTANNGKNVWLPVRTWDKSTDSKGVLWGTIT
ncbi:SH3 domain-containing protein [Staphylococcus lugdunensis]|uniref:SH3 domain-containing protein n=1 Tax=Staphylococcus lugdunensis TaxID=28035 RepID=UPI001F4CFA64|nr:SH3 domain-containing protein [Staphylococcus lugdunensis]MCH8673950.1 SH3 domain-containing protein [Staphylococcus lugdunensis]